jgi:uncharacterized protein (TIGR02246 family)
MVRALTLSLMLVFCTAGFTLAATSQEDAENYMLMHSIESTWHQAATNKNVDLIMTLFADDGVLTAHGTTYKGKDQLRAFWEKGAAFQPQSQLIGYTAPYRLKYDLEGDKGHLYFECLYVDNATKKIASHVGVNVELARKNGRWLIESAKTTPLPQL